MVSSAGNATEVTTMELLWTEDRVELFLPVKRHLLLIVHVAFSTGVTW